MRTKWLGLGLLAGLGLSILFAQAQQGGGTYNPGGAGYWPTQSALSAAIPCTPAVPMTMLALTGDQQLTYCNGSTWAQIYPRLSAVSASVSGALLTALNPCTAAQTVTVTGAAVGATVELGAVTAQPAGIIGMGSVTSANTVTFYVCTVQLISLTSVSSTWNVKVFPT